MKYKELRVLIYEDDPLDLKLTINELKQEFPDVIIRSTFKGEDFKNLLREFEPQIVLSDFNLPGFNGLEAINYVRRDYPDLPIIIITGSLDEETAAGCMKEGAWDYLLKDHISRLNPAVEMALSHREEMIRRKETEQKLIESEEHYRTITQNSPDLIMRFDKNYRHVFVNETVKSMLGIQPELFLNKTHQEMEVFPVEKCLFWEDAIERVFNTKKPYTTHFEVKSSSGILDLEWRLFPEFNELREVDTVLAIARDVSEKRISSELLNESRKMLQVVLDNVPMGIFWKDKNSVFLGCNTTFARSAGFNSPEEITGKTEFDLSVQYTDPIKFVNLDRQVIIQDKACWDILDEVTIAGNKKAWYNTNKIPLHNERGEVIGVLGTVEDITEKRNARIALKNSEERLKTALEGTSDGLIDWEVGKRKAYLSPRFFAMLDYNPEDYSHDIRLFRKFVHPGDREKIISRMNKAFTNREDTFDLEYRLINKQGQYVWILGRGKIVYSKDGKPRRLVGTHVNISQRKRYENIQKVLTEIANSVNNTRDLDDLFLQIQRSLNSVLDTRNCYIAMYNEESDTITLPFHQDEKDKFTEFPVGKTLTGYVIKTGKALLANSDKIQELEDTNQIESIGTPSVSWLGTPLKISDKILGVFAVQSYRDNITYTEEDVKILEFVSDQVALAIERKIDQDNLKKNELRQRRIIESTPDGLAVIDMEGKILDYNSTFKTLINWDLNKKLNASFFDFVDDEDVISVQNVLNETLNYSYYKNFEFKMKQYLGETFFTETSFGLLQGEGTKESNFVIVIKNINDRKSYEQNLRIAKEKAEESDRLKSAFLSNMSHEIRTPMNAIIGFSELLYARDITPEEGQEYIKQINFAADSLMHLIDDIIDISKIEAGQLNVHYSSFSLQKMFADLKTMFAGMLEQKHKHQVELIEDNHFCNTAVQINSDEYRLRQVFSNLLGNAIKFTQEGSIRFGIKSIYRRNITFYVRDTGIGISKDKHEYIFERFRQENPDATLVNSGTGLGLAICKNIVEILGGSISVQSALNEGAEFTFTIPCLDPGNYEKLQEESDQNGEIDWKGLTFLIAEDDHLNYMVLKEKLKTYGVRLIHAGNGREAVKFFHSTKEIDLVLMDIQMPELNGYEATRLIKQINPNVPIIAQTAYAMAGEREASIKAGCDDYLSKPLKMDELIVVIKRNLKH